VIIILKNVQSPSCKYYFLGYKHSSLFSAASAAK
jgi:hypothetical protein